MISQNFIGFAWRQFSAIAYLLPLLAATLQDDAIFAPKHSFHALRTYLAHHADAATLRWARERDTAEKILIFHIKGAADARSKRET